MKKKAGIFLAILLLLAVISIIVLHTCPSIEQWLHHATGWY